MGEWGAKEETGVTDVVAVQVLGGGAFALE